MTALFFGMAWGFYGVGTWGWVLLKGYDITFTQWFNPFKPYIWSGTPAMVPAGAVLPNGQGAASDKTAAKVQVA